MGNVWTKIEENLPSEWKKCLIFEEEPLSCAACLDADAIFPEWNGSFPYRDEDQKADDELTSDASSDSDGSTHSDSDSEDDDATEDADSTTSLHSTSAVMTEDGGLGAKPVGYMIASIIPKFTLRLRFEMKL